MIKCALCFAVTGNEADYAVSFGREDRSLRVCRWCLEDLRLLGFDANQVVSITQEHTAKLQPNTAFAANSRLLEVKAHG